MKKRNPKVEFAYEFIGNGVANHAKPTDVRVPRAPVPDGLLADRPPGPVITAIASAADSNDG
jgi:hypothetical protein